MTENNLSIYHITWVTYCSRVSQRMKLYSKKRDLYSIILNEEQEIEVTSYICRIVKENNLIILSYNICSDHIHLILFCKKFERDNITRKLKGKSTQMYKDNNGIENTFHLWAQKYNHLEITNYTQLLNTIEYIKNNRAKHKLAENKGLQPLVLRMITSLKELKYKFINEETYHTNLK